MAGLVIGITDHAGWAALVTACGDGKLWDRRRVELVDAGLPRMPHHSEGRKLPIEDAVELVNRVWLSAESHAKIALDAVAEAVAQPIRGVALRECPSWLPSQVAERITDYRSQNTADWVMYRKAIAKAAEARRWDVFWYDSRKVISLAGDALGIADFEIHFQAMRRTAGAPWGNDQRVALAAAIVGALR